MILNTKECLHIGAAQFFDIDRVLYQGQSQYQEMLLFENQTFGKVLMLDGIVQVTTKDSFIYHEMITHVGMFTHGAVENVLIIGGGDGGVLHEVLRHKTVKKVALVELDSQVIDCSKKYLEEVHHDSFYNNRACIFIMDGFVFIKETQDQWDLIIVDSTDPVGPGDILFSDQFYSFCSKALTENGILITQSGVPFFQRNEFKRSYQRLSKHFDLVTFYRAAIPTYYGGDMTFGFSSKKVLYGQLNDVIARRIIQSGLRFLYYTYQIHKAAFSLPAYLMEDLNDFVGSY